MNWVKDFVIRRDLREGRIDDVDHDRRIAEHIMAACADKPVRKINNTNDIRGVPNPAKKTPLTEETITPPSTKEK